MGGTRRPGRGGGGEVWVHGHGRRIHGKTRSLSGIGVVDKPSSHECDPLALGKEEGNPGHDMMGVVCWELQWCGPNVNPWI